MCCVGSAACVCFFIFQNQFVGLGKFIQKMNKQLLYTVWSQKRDKKSLVLVDREEDQLSCLIVNASKKLHIEGRTLVLESNGTDIDTSDILEYVRGEPLILLEATEKWIPATTFTSSAVSSDSSAVLCEVKGNNDTIVPVNDISLEILDVNVTENNNIEITENKENETSTFIDKCKIIVDCNAEQIWQNFLVPYEKLSSDELDMLAQNKLENRTRKKMIHVIVHEMRLIKENIPTKAFRYVAKKIIDKYPDTFLDKDDDGIVLGDGTHSLVKQMAEHNHYLNRPQKRQTCNESAAENPSNNKKQMVKFRSGCGKNWSPKVNSEIDLNELQMTTETEDLNLLETTYPQIRQILNRNPPPTILHIKEEWPLLFSETSIHWHFRKLTTADLNLLDSMAEKSEKIIICLKVAEDKIYAVNELELLSKLAAHFKEDVNLIYIEQENLDIDILKGTAPVTPYVLKAGSNNTYFVVVENVIINCDGYKDFITAFKICFGLYFIMNLVYPKNFETTLEFVQRQFLKIHPDAGNKTKKVSASRKKVFALMSKITKF